jgi:hypothetical protein
MKKLVRLTEGDLHRIVKESVNKVIDKSNSVFYGDKPSRITKMDRSNDNKHIISSDEEKKLRKYVSEASATPNGFKHRIDPNKRDGDFPLEQPEWTKDPRWQGWQGEDPEWIMKQEKESGDPYYGSKKPVRVSEAQLHQIVKESIEQVLDEGFFDKFRRTANARDAYKDLDGNYSYSKDNDRFYYHDKYGNKHDTGIGYGKGKVGSNWNPFSKHFWNGGDRQVTQYDANRAKRRLQYFDDDSWEGRKHIDYNAKRAYDNEQERKRQEAWREQQRREEQEANRRRAEYEADRRADARQAEKAAYEDYVNKQQWMR